MKKLTLALAVIGMAMFLGSSAWAGGRLNFMLINLTGHDIIDAKIYPTYYPKYESENLLKTTLDPNSRVYIGPNYYGEQNFWNIALKWANGYEHTFSKLRLTRYNTYTVYSTPQGLKIRQTYEPASARYEFGPDAPSYMGAEPDVVVKASAPEKLAEIPTIPSADVVEPGNATSTGTSSKLNFDADTAMNGSGTSAAKAMAIKTTVETTRDGKINTVSPTGDFKTGDQVKLLFSTNKDGHIYWIKKDGADQYKILFPSPQNANDNSVVHNKEYSVPVSDPLKFGEKQETETIFAILSPKAIPDLDKAIKLESEGKKAEASTLISDLVTNHEKKRTSRELIFEEEDDDDVNTQTQLADGEDYPLVSTYELTHN